VYFPVWIFSVFWWSIISIAAELDFASHSANRQETVQAWVLVQRPARLYHVPLTANPEHGWLHAQPGFIHAPKIFHHPNRFHDSHIQPDRLRQ
jgi:hypothetical protein